MVGVRRRRAIVSLGVWLLLIIAMTTVFWVELDYVRQLKLSDQNMQAEESVEVVVKRLSLTEKRLPNVLVIGAMKAGTSTLMRYLHFHPDTACALNEVNYFEQDDNYNQGVEWYRDQMPLSLPGQTVIEKSPAYLQWTRKVPQRVHAYNSSIKLIAILKDPVKRTVSHYTHRLAVGLRDVPTFQHLVMDESTQEVNRNSLLVNTGMYYARIQDWFQWFPKKQFLFLNGEQFVKRPWEVLQETESFLGLRPFFNSQQFIYNATKGFYCFKTNSVHCMSNHKGRPHPEIKFHLLDKVQNFFNLENQKLYVLLNRTFNWPVVIPRSENTKIKV